MVSDILLTLGSSGMLMSFIEFVKVWLQRDTSRSLTLSWSDEGQLQHVELTGERLDEATLAQVMQSVSQRLADSA